VVPGLRETLRVNGKAQITRDPALLDACAVNGKAPRSGILVAVDEVYFHCGKAIIRSDLWNPEKHTAQKDFPMLGRIIAEQIGEVSEDVKQQAERATEEGYVTRLY
jgi:predicted pyridoxine 5'-phosphate oxidase superfamily flavin-nucleotide-binding protein